MSDNMSDTVCCHCGHALNLHRSVVPFLCMVGAPGPLGICACERGIHQQLQTTRKAASGLGDLPSLAPSPSSAVPKTLTDGEQASLEKIALWRAYAGQVKAILRDAKDFAAFDVHVARLLDEALALPTPDHASEEP